VIPGVLQFGEFPTFALAQRDDLAIVTLVGLGDFRINRIKPHGFFRGSVLLREVEPGQARGVRDRAQKTAGSGQEYGQAASACVGVTITALPGELQRLRGFDGVLHACISRCWQTENGAFIYSERRQSRFVVAFFRWLRAAPRQALLS